MNTEETLKIISDRADEYIDDLNNQLGDDKLPDVFGEIIKNAYKAGYISGSIDAIQKFTTPKIITPSGTN